MDFKYLIIGGGVAGTTASNAIRQNDSQGSITIVSDEPHYLYSRIMLSKPNFFLGKIPFEQIWLKDKSWYEQNKIEFIGGKKAIQLDPDKKIIKLDDDTEIKYDKLLLATGLNARHLSVPGADKQGVFYLRTLDHGKSIIEAVSSVKKAVAIGGGFISFEMANLLQLSGAEVSIIIRESLFWDPILDATASKIVETAITKANVKIVRNAEIKQVGGNSHVTSVTLSDNTTLPCDMVICGIGANCDTGWLKKSGLKTDRAILADQYLKTNLPDVWSAGDATAFDDPILQEIVHLGNWVNAQEQGRIAGLNMVGQKQSFTFVSYYTTHGFDISVTFIGNVRPKNEFQTIVRSGPGEGVHTQLLVINDELVGAVLINQTQILRPITQLIEKNVNMADKHEQLSDPNFDLNTLIPQQPSCPTN
ncbi:MAG: FAD-dependent oxidoreductase [bacterium]